MKRRTWDIYISLVHNLMLVPALGHEHQDDAGIDSIPILALHCQR